MRSIFLEKLDALLLEFLSEKGFDFEGYGFLDYLVKAHQLLSKIDPDDHRLDFLSVVGYYDLVADVEFCVVH